MEAPFATSPFVLASEKTLGVGVGGSDACARGLGRVIGPREGFRCFSNAAMSGAMAPSLKRMRTSLEGEAPRRVTGKTTEMESRATPGDERDPLGACAATAAEPAGSQQTSEQNVAKGAIQLGCEIPPDEEETQLMTGR